MASTSTSKLFPGFSSIYHLTSTGSDRPFHASVDMADTFSVIRCEITPPKPVSARWHSGSKKPGDIIWTTFAGQLLLSERIVMLLGECGFTGWKTYDVNLAGHDGMSISGYYGLAIYGRCGPIDNDQSVKVPKQYPGGVFPVWKGLYFDPKTWDGSDIFVPGDRGAWDFILREVKEALEKAKIRNVLLTPLDEVERDML